MNKNVKLEKWQAAQKRHRLSDKQARMGMELGLNPDKLGKIDNHKQETWKTPLPQFIEEIYFKRFKKTAPDVVKSIREQIADEKIKKDRQKKAKEQKRKEKTKIQEDKSFVDDCGENENPAKPVTLSQKIKLYDKKPKVRIRTESGDTPETILRKEAHLFDEAFDFYEKESVTLSQLGFILKKIHPQYKPRRYGCKTLGAIYEKLDGYEVVQTEESVAIIRRKQDNS
jgi:Sec-independent protein translocase protein TatA